MINLRPELGTMFGSYILVDVSSLPGVSRVFLHDHRSMDPLLHHTHNIPTKTVEKDTLFDGALNHRTLLVNKRILRDLTVKIPPESIPQEDE